MPSMKMNHPGKPVRVYRPRGIGALLALAVMVLAACSASIAEAPLVSYAGPVPEGALARLGKGRIDGLALSPDGRSLAVATDVGLALYDAETLEQQWAQASLKPIQVVSFAGDGRLLATGAADGQVSIVATADGQVLDALKAAAAATALAWQPASGSGQPGGLLAAGFANGDAAVVRVDQVGDRAQLSPVGQLPRHPAGVSALAFAPGGTALASGDISGTVNLWAVPGLRRLGRLQGHPSFHRVQALAWLPSGQELASADSKGAVLVWRVDQEEPEQVLAREGSPVLALQANLAGDALSAVGEDGRLSMWTTAVAPAHHALVPTDVEATRAALVAGEGLVAVATANGGLAMWRVDGEGGAPERLAMLQGHAGRYTPTEAMAWSPDGQRLASASADGEALLWDIEAQTRVPVAAHNSVVRGLAFSPDGRQLATAAKDGLVMIWDMATEPVLRAARTLAGHAAGVNGVAWSADGRRLASSADDNSVVVWEVDPTVPRPVPTPGSDQG